MTHIAAISSSQAPETEPEEKYQGSLHGITGFKSCRDILQLATLATLALIFGPNCMCI